MLSNEKISPDKSIFKNNVIKAQPNKSNITNAIFTIQISEENEKTTFLQVLRFYRFHFLSK